MAKMGSTPHVKLFIDKDGQLYIYDQLTKDKQLIAMRKNPDGTKTSRSLASEVEDAIWEFRWSHKDSKESKTKGESLGQAESS